MTAEPTAEVLQFANKPTASFVSVTPEVAKRWLGANTKNRRINPPDLNRYKRDMLAGRWHLDGAPIRFSADGALLDGQHRLLAIVETGVTLPLLVVRGIDPEAQQVMDTGKRRSAADALAINGYRYPVMGAAVARLILEVETGNLSTGGQFEVSHEEVLACLDLNPDVESAIAFTSPLARRTDCPPAMVAYSYLIMRRVSEKDAAEFWVSMAEKVGLREGDPVIALGNRLAEARRNRERLDRRILLSLIYRAWNARRAGQPIRLLRVNYTSREGVRRVVSIPDPH